MLTKLEIYPPVKSNVEDGQTVGSSEVRLILNGPYNIDELFMVTGNSYLKQNRPTVMIEEKVYITTGTVKALAIIHYHGYLVEDDIVFITATVNVPNRSVQYLCLPGINYFVNRTVDDIISVPHFITNEFGIDFSGKYFQGAMADKWYAPKSESIISELTDTGRILSDYYNGINVDETDEQSIQDLHATFMYLWYENDNTLLRYLFHSYLSIFGEGIFPIKNIYRSMQKQDIRELISGNVTETDALRSILYPDKENTKLVPLIKDIFNQNVKVEEIPDMINTNNLLINGGSIDVDKDKVLYTDWLSQCVAHPQLVCS